jgi:hypothetical protein
MRHLLVAAVLLSGCSSAPHPERSIPSSGTLSGPSATRDVADLDPWNGREVTLEGTFDHVRAIHGLIRLDSGLTILVNHFDLFARGEDWLKHVGKRCAAAGILHTYTKNVENYHGPRLEIFEFTGSQE